MPRPTLLARRQLPLYRDRDLQYAPPDDLREEIVNVLADLLLEALGEPTGTQPTGGDDEPEDHA